MATPEPSFQLRPEQRAPLRELPLWTVMFVSGLVLLVGLGDDHPKGGAQAATNDLGNDGAGPESFPMVAANHEGAPALVEVMVSERAAVQLNSGELQSGTATAEASGHASAVHAEEPSAAGARHQPPPHRRALGGTHPLPPSEEGAFVGGIRHGDWLVRWPSGQTHSKGRYRDGLRDGPWQSYSVTGDLVEEMSYSSGALEGAWRAYSPDGEVLGEGQHEDNHRVGSWILYYSNGRIKEQGTYVDGLREGHWEFYDDLGLPTTRCGQYRAGVKID